MEINAAKQFAGSYTGTSSAQSQTVKTESIKTDLPATKAVTSTEDTSKSSKEFKQKVSDDTLVSAQSEPPKAPEKKTIQSYDQDKESGEMVFRAFNKTTGDVVVQIPSELKIKMKSYTEEAPGAGGYRSESLNTKLDTTI